MRALIFIASLLMLASCYTKQQAIKKFCVPEPITIDSNWNVKGFVNDSAKHANFELPDSCGILKTLYDSLVNSGSFVQDTFVKHDTILKNNAVSATKWAILYTDSLFIVKFRIKANGKAQFDVEKLARKIPYTAPVNFKKVINQPCPPPEELPWWYDLYWFFASFFFGTVAFFALKK